MELKELFHQKKINFKMYNVCLKNNINTQNELIEFFKKNGDFLQFKNCGNKTNLELINFCTQNNVEEFNLKAIIPYLKEEDKKLIDDFINFKFKKLNNRSQNGLLKLFSKEINLENFLIKGILEPEFEYLKIPFLGLKSAKEIKEYFTEIREYIKKISPEVNKNPIIE